MKDSIAQVLLCAAVIATGLAAIASALGIWRIVNEYGSRREGENDD